MTYAAKVHKNRILTPFLPQPLLNLLILKIDYKVGQSINHLYSSFVPNLPFCALVVSLKRSRAVSFESDKILLQGKGSSCASFIAFTCATHCEQVTESLSFSQTLGPVLFYQLPKCNIYTLDALLKVFHKYIHPSQFILNQLEPKWKNSVHISGNCWSGKAILKFLLWICACYDNSGFCFDKPKHPTVVDAQRTMLYIKCFILFCLYLFFHSTRILLEIFPYNWPWGCGHFGSIVTAGQKACSYS